MSVKPRRLPEVMLSSPVVSVLFEPWIEWTLGCSEGSCSSSPYSGPQPLVYELVASQEPVKSQ